MDVTTRKAAEETLQRRVDALRTLVTCPEADLPERLHLVTEASASVLDVERVSIWRYTSDRSEIECEDLFLRNKDDHEHGIRLSAKQYPRYFAAMERGQVIAADDARTHEATREFRDNYLDPLGIKSMLDVPIWVGGRMAGVLCHEHTGKFRHWTPEEQEFAISVAATLSLALEVEERRRAEEAVREADRRKSEFLAMLAHELRNPLAAVRNALQACRDSGDRETCDWAHAVIDRQSLQLTRLVDDLLDVSRITSGKIQLRKEHIDAAFALDHAVEAVRPQIDERKHELAASYDHGVLGVDADPTRLQQIVTNLLSNAVRYTQPGGCIWLDAAKEKNEVVIRVRDTGAGIPPEKIPEMFKIFTQGQRQISRTDGGLGLGLAIVKTLTEMHGGSVSARSEGLGLGSEFTVRLPAVSLEGTHPSSLLLAQPAGPEEGTRVLIIEDNADTAQGMARLLKSRGCTVDVAYDGRAALEHAREFHPHAVLLDIGLPGMDGYEVANLLRKEPCCDGVLLIAISGYGQEEDLKRSHEAGFDHHLVKPVNIDHLRRLLGTAIHEVP